LCGFSFAWFDFEGASWRRRIVASVVRRRRKDGSPSWYARYRDGRGKDVWEHCTTAREARARAAEVELELARSAGEWSRPAKVTFGEYAEQWLDAHGRTIRPRTLAGYRRIFMYDLLPRFGHLPLSAITRRQVKAFLNERAAGGAAANTLRNILAPMRVMLAAALDDELIRTNPAAGIRCTGRQARRVEPPPPTSVRAVLDAASLRGRLPILLAATAGLRRGEIFALRWDDVDFDARTIRVHASNHGAGLITETKTAAGERLVPMFGSVRAVLLEHKAATAFKQPDDLLFATMFGTPESPNGWLKREFYPALKRAGVEHFRFHDLRHFAVSQLIAQGANIVQLARVAGHADPSVTLKVYSHLMADGLAEAAARYDPLRPLAGGVR
jgi:integrase